MPPKRAPKPITSIKRTGELDADFTIFENKFINQQIEEIEADTENHIVDANGMTVKRRAKVIDEEKNSENNRDIYRYLSSKKKEKDQELAFYEKKLQEARETHKKLQQDLQSEMDKLKQNHDLQLNQLSSILKTNKAKCDSLATVAAFEKQLCREIADAENTLHSEELVQGKALSDANKQFSDTVKKQAEEMIEKVEEEKKKNRGMTKDNLEDTVIKMMQEKNDEKNALAEQVKQSKLIADANTKLMETNKQLYMKRDLLQSECENLQRRISSNDEVIRNLVEELKANDQKISNEMENEEMEEDTEAPAETVARTMPALDEEADEKVDSPKPKDRETILNNFFDDAVNTLCNSIVKILQVIDSQHAQDYLQFHDAFDSFEGRKKELRFLMSKLGNLTFEPDKDKMLPPIGLESIEGVDEDYTKKNLIDPQNKAIMEFAGPIGDEEYPDLIATHFFQ